MKTLFLNCKNRSQLEELDDLANQLESLAHSSGSNTNVQPGKRPCRIASLAEMKNDTNILKTTTSEKNVVFVDFNK